jgi:transposase
MKNITTIGVDLAKNYIQIHGADSQGRCVLKKRIHRDDFLTFMAKLPKCVVGMEACGGSNYWATQLNRIGHCAKIMSPDKVKAYVGHNKNDSKDARACCEAVSRPDMSFVSLKNQLQMEMQTLHRVRSHHVKAHTSMMNMIRGLLGEQGIAIAKSESSLMKRLALLIEENKLSPLLIELFSGLKIKLGETREAIKTITKQIIDLGEQDEACKKLQTIDGIGPITATALISKIGHGSEFKNGRELSAYLGLVPRQASSGNKQVLLGITKHGDRYIRQLLVHGGRAAVLAAKRVDQSTGAFIKQDPHSEWIRKLDERVDSRNKASVAVANKNARMVIALLKKDMEFDAELAHYDVALGH